MALDFPNSPTTGTVYTFANKSWTYDGAKWVITQYTDVLNEEVTNAITVAKKSAFALSFVLS